MAQSIVPIFYSTRKKLREPVKNVKDVKKEDLSEILKDFSSTALHTEKTDVKNSTQRCKKTVNVVETDAKTQKLKTKSKTQKSVKAEKLVDTEVKIQDPAKSDAKAQKSKKIKNLVKTESKTQKSGKSEKFIETEVKIQNPVKSENIVENYVKTQKSVEANVNTKKYVRKSKNTNGKSKQVNKITNYLKSDPESVKTIHEKSVSEEKSEVPRTPKRNLSTPEELTPSKKQQRDFREVISTQESSPSKLKSLTPIKRETIVSKKLHFSSPNRFGSPKKFGSPVKSDLTPQKAALYENLSNKDLASIVANSRSKILLSGRLDELKTALETFSSNVSKVKQFQSNPCKLTSVVASAKSSDKETNLASKGTPACQKYSYLADPDWVSSLILPNKYKLLEEAFRCFDVVVKMYNNRKEIITFEKVKDGVQDMMKKNFSLNHLGQIMTVFPTAYSLQYEKYDSYTIKKTSSPYQLIITPILAESSGNSTNIPSKIDQKNSQNKFTYMTPQHLLERTHVFKQKLLEIMKKHHQDFLKKIGFSAVPNEKIVRWHPKFPIKSVPDIPVSMLPDVPEAKVYTARDVLNKIKGTVHARVEKALKSVSDAHSSESKEDSITKTDPEKDIQKKKQNSALYGVCTDLLERIRARESAKLIETMTRSATDEKRLSMLEQIPKIVRILWHYFIAERKSTIHIDAAVEKIIHSLNSLTTPDSVKEHLDLIRETMPGWLSYIKIPKGVFLTIDKTKDIEAMLTRIK